MRDVCVDLRRLGGLATRSRLGRAGHPPRRIAEAVQDGRCIRAGRSWVALPDANPEAIRAVAARGILGGESALRSYGVWVSRNTGVCIATRRSSSRLPGPGSGAYRVWRSDGPSMSCEWRVGIVDALAQHLPRVAEPFHAAATLDSVLHRRLLTSVDLVDLMERMPRRVRRLHRHLDAAAESGLETLLRLAMRDQGWRVETQVEIPGVGRVDFVIDGWLVIEADGSAWHDSRESVRRDRERNAALVRRGYRWHRFGYSQIMNDLDGCVAVINALLSGGRPLR